MSFNRRSFIDVLTKGAAGFAFGAGAAKAATPAEPVLVQGRVFSVCPKLEEPEETQPLDLHEKVKALPNVTGMKFGEIVRLVEQDELTNNGLWQVSTAGFFGHGEKVWNQLTQDWTLEEGADGEILTVRTKSLPFGNTPIRDNLTSGGSQRDPMRHTAASNEDARTMLGLIPGDEIIVLSMPEDITEITHESGLRLTMKG